MKVMSTVIPIFGWNIGCYKRSQNRVKWRIKVGGTKRKSKEKHRENGHFRNHVKGEIIENILGTSMQ